ncbi:MAG: hypothetical protein Q8M03_13315 [Legionella sp.]|nr:hypothetical protein [Legionella sp.]
MTARYCSRNLILIPILIILAILCINFTAILAALQQNYYVYEQDAYMHMVLTLDLLKTHDWYQHFTARVNAPFGADLHGWTQPIKILLAGGAVAFNIILPLKEALYLWSFIVPMLLSAIAAVGMWWAIRVFKPSCYQQYFVIAAFLFNPFLNALFTPLRVDYDFLLVTLSIYYWGFLFRLDTPHQKSSAIGAAIMAGFGVWTSISFMIIALIGIASIFWQSLIRQHLRIATVNTFMSVLAITLIGCIWLEHRHFFNIAHDILSIVHLTFILLLLLAFNFYQYFLQQGKPVLKIAYIFLATVMLFLVMNYLFPGFYYGPYTHIDPYLLENFFPGLSEFYSPFRIDNALALALLFYFIVGIAYCYYLYLDKRAKSSLPWLLILSTTITTILTLYMYRWHDFSVPLTILLVSFFVAAICNYKISSLAKILLIGLMALMPHFILLLTKDYLPLAHHQCQKQFYSMMQDGFFNNPAFSEDKILLAHSNYGPLLLYSTHFSIIATNDHHNLQGVKDSFDFFKKDKLSAQKIVSKRKADLFLVCPSEHAPSFDYQKSAWLSPVALPEKYSKWQLYRINAVNNYNPD